MNVVSSEDLIRRRRLATAQLMDPSLQIGRSGAKIDPASRSDVSSDSKAPHPAPGEPAPAPVSPAPQAGSRSNVLDEEIRLILDSSLFDADWYGQSTGQPTADTALLIRHYLRCAETERFGPNPLFDRAFYAQSCDQELGDVDPFVHYLREGWARRLDPHPLFSVGFYLDGNADVRAAAVEPLAHYLLHGWREGRSPCAEFDVGFYLTKNEDVRSRNFEPLRHYVENGATEGRDPSPIFETRWYAQHILKGEALNPLAHFRAAGSNPDLLMREVALGAHHEMSQSDFERWTRAFRSREVERPAGSLVRVHGDVSPGADSLATARAESRAASPPEGCAYIVCEPTDTLDERLVPHLLRRLTRAELVVFDFAFQRGDVWTPVLLAGANAVQIEAVDATFSRFAISSRLLGRLDVDADATPWTVLKAAIDQLRSEGRLERFAHLPVPLLRAEDLSPTLQTTRRRLARDAYLGAPRGGAAVEGLSVSVVICTKDRCRLLTQLLDHLAAFPTQVVRDIVVVTNAAAESFAADVHAHHVGRGRVELLRHKGPYNFSQQSNRGAARCTGDLLLFLNDDVVPIVPHWLDVLRAPFARPEVGITGPLLFYPDESLQHAGMYLGFNGVAGHTLRSARLPDGDYMLDAGAPRNVSVVTGAVMLTRRSLFEDLNGFDRQLGTYLQDVDYCLRVLNCDREVIYEPRAFLFHMESVSMRDKATETVFGERRPLEHRHFMRKWPDALRADAFHNPNFDVQDESLRTLARIPLDLR